MGIGKSIEKGLIFGVIILFILSANSPMSIKLEKIGRNSDVNFDSYNISEISNYEQHYTYKEHAYDNIESEGITLPTKTTSVGPMNSSWPMYCHDVRHTGRSPYSTADNLGIEKWRFGTTGWTMGSPVIGNDDTIYIGAKDFYAVYPNGTLKWKYDVPYHIWLAPAIDENGVIYAGTENAMPNYLYAFYPNGTLKWKYETGESIRSSPAIGNDGTIYFGDANNYINALYPTGTLRWRYKTGHAVYSSPAISEEGIVYCGSHDTYLYALYPNNGTVEWKYKTGNWIRTSPCIADDGTIYVVSLDNYLHAVYSNGTLKWKTNVGAGTSPTIGQDGTIYAGYSKLYAINSINGSVKWTFSPGTDRRIRGGTPCNSADGTIYFGTHIGEYDGGEIIAVNPDGTERWRKMIANDWVDSAPAIGGDGTVYIGSSWQPSNGYLHAFGELDPNAPDAPGIDGQTSGKAGKEYEYKFKSTDPNGDDVYYYIEWGDGKIEDWIGPIPSGEEIRVTHTWDEKGSYTIKARAKDTNNLWGPWGELEVTMPKNQNRQMHNSWFLQNHPRMFPILRQLLGL